MMKRGTDIDRTHEPKVDEDTAAMAAKAKTPLANPGLLKDVPVTLQARLGEISMSVEELLGLTAGAVLTLDLQLNEPIGLYLNQTLVARGEIVAVNDRFGIRITDVAAP
jgi:flagellar motor switch protein FliN/FliY